MATAATENAATRDKSSKTIAEVFIIESLNLEDEKEGLLEGAVLASVLKMCGKDPRYHYIRTKAELKWIAREFEESGYRYLHISCHGNKTVLATTLDSVTYDDFAKIFKGKLESRRLFISTCRAGNEAFAKAVCSMNTGVISVAAFSRKIGFDEAVAFWTAFYVKTFSLNSESMNSSRIVQVARPLAKLFSEPLYFCRRKSGGWDDELIKG